jgi:isoquinoline 1-oxidoreductase subunit alpha
MATLTVNGKPYTVNVPADTPLLWVIREHLQPTGTKFGCGVAQCGARQVPLQPDRVLRAMQQKA